MKVHPGFIPVLVRPFSHAILLGSLAILILMLSPAQAATTFVTGQTLSPNKWNNYTGWKGMKITVGSSPISVTELGRWVIAGNTGTHTVKLVTAGGGAISGGSVSVATSGATAGQFKYVALAAPVVLQANTVYFLVSNETQGGDFWWGYTTTLVHTSAAAINNAVTSADSVSFTNDGTTDNCSVPLSFKYDLLPAAPSGLVATAISSSQIDLAWADNSSNETGFEVERKTGAGGSYSQIATPGAIGGTGGTGTHDDTGLAGSTSYYYRVRASNASGHSAYSSEASATTLAQPSLIGHWKLDETMGTTAADSSGNGHTGTLSNFSGTYWVPGTFANGLGFDGTNDSVNCGSAAAFDNLPAVTVAAWIKATNMGEASYGRIVHKAGVTGPAAGWAFYVSGTNQLTFAVDHGSPDLLRQTVTNSITPGVWTHVAATWTGSTNATNVKIYVNGVETTYVVTTNGGSSRVDDAASNLYIGNDSSGARTFNGVIDEVRLYDGVLSASEIEELAQTQVLIWQSDESTQSIDADGTTIFDAWGPLPASGTGNFHPERWTIQYDPAGGGGKVYQCKMVGESGATCARDIMAQWNGGNGTAGTGSEIIDIAFETEVYWKSPSNMAAGGDNKLCRLGGSVFNTTAQRNVVNDPSASFSLHYQGGPPDELAAYCYYVDNPGSYGTFVDNDDVLPTDQWVHLRMEIRGGSGDETGTIKLYIDGELSASRSGIKWHATAGKGWRHVAMSMARQDLINTTFPENVDYYWLRNLKVYALAP